MIRLVCEDGHSAEEHAMHAYNLFRSKDSDAMFCAVAEDCSVPAFVTAPRWEFRGRIDGQRSRPIGFDKKAADCGTRFIGFYLFPDFQRERT
jgi:hypothetical protein